MGSSDAGLVRLVGAVRDMMPPSASIASLVSDPIPISTASPITGTPEVDGDDCRLMGPFALFVQAIMGILVIGSLVYKRQREKPKRKWKIWALDISKQMLGQLFVHILNIVLSDFVASGGGENPCSLYFLNVLVDTTVGVFFIYIALKWVTYLLTERFGLEGFVSGQYTPPLPPIIPASRSSSPSLHSGTSRGSFRRGRPRLEYWFKQLASYLFVLFLMKMAVLVSFALFPFLFDVGSWILSFFGRHKHVQVLFSMALFPLAMNVLQFWLIDSLLRHNPYTSAYSKINPDDEDFLNSSDRISQDSRFSESRPSLERGRSAHSIGEASDDDERDHVDKLHVQPHASGSAQSRRRASPSATDQPYNYPPPTDLYGSVHKSPPLHPSRPTDEMRRQASLTLSDAGSDEDGDSQAQNMSSSKASLRPESHHLKQVPDSK